MKTLQLAAEVSNSPSIERLSLLSSRLAHRLFALLLLALIAAVTIAATTGSWHSGGCANLMLAPGQGGVEPTVY